MKRRVLPKTIEIPTRDLSSVVFLTDWSEDHVPSWLTDEFDYELCFRVTRHGEDPDEAEVVVLHQTEVDHLLELMSEARLTGVRTDQIVIGVPLGDEVVPVGGTDFLRFIDGLIHTKMELEVESAAFGMAFVPEGIKPPN